MLAELAHATEASETVLREFVAHVGSRVDLEPFDHGAALIAGKALCVLFPDRKPGENRHQLKFDVQIAAIAHSIKAKYLVTGETNPRGFPRYLDAMGSETELIVGPKLPPGYQLDWTDDPDEEE